MNKKYVTSVFLLTFVIPATGFFTEHCTRDTPLSFELLAKWFIFSAVGLRLLIAGIQQTTKPAFTARAIFHIDHSDCLPIVRELGFANLCFGLVGIISVWKPQWRIVSAFASGIYYGIAGLQHLINKPASINAAFAMWTDLIIFGMLLAYMITAC